MSARCTGAYNTKIGTSQTIADRNIAAGGIGHKPWNTEGGNLIRPFIQDSQVLIFDLLDTAYTRTYDNTGTKSVFFREIEPAVIYRLTRCSHGELGKAVHSLTFPPINVFRHIEVLYLATKTYGVRTGIERSDSGNTALALAKCREKLVSGLG